MTGAASKARHGVKLVILVAGLAMVGARATSVSGLPSDLKTVARVNGWRLNEREFDAAARRVGATDSGTRAALLRYMVGEELLVQRAEEIGLLRSDPQLRKLAIRRVIDAASQAAFQKMPSPDQLAGYAQKHPEITDPSLVLTAYRADQARIALCDVVSLQRDRTAVSIAIDYRNDGSRERLAGVGECSS